MTINRVLLFRKRKYVVCRFTNRATDHAALDPQGLGEFLAEVGGVKSQQRIDQWLGPKR